MIHQRIRRQPTRAMIARTYAAFWLLLITNGALFVGCVWLAYEIVKSWGWFA